MPQHPPARPLPRLARAVVFATVCLTLTTAGHAYAAGSAVPAGTVGLGFALVTAFSALLAGTERSFATILGGLLGAQFGLHALFTQASAGAVHHAGAGPAGHQAHDGPAMTLAHLLAALAAAWWLRRGEAALWSLARRVAAGVLRRPLVLPAVTPPPRPAVRRRGAVPSPARAPLRHVLIRRGPPGRLSTHAS
ncbi:hypothetical protein ACSNOI_12160 [Actinomadura kijaniata]|uniref:hypothetical protein n=1 Tax=Actinomadura kijaniata TaxID=46161 RepID=UPI003F1B4C4A